MALSDININDYLPIPKYIRLYNNEEEYQEDIDNHVIEECAYSCVNKGNLVERLEYQPSHRTTNNDNLKLMHYLSEDIIKLWSGLKIIWGYFGWEETDFVLNGETLKGGNFYKVKPMTVVQTVPDLYQYQHLNDFLKNINTVTEYQPQDFSTIKSASYLVNSTIYHNYSGIDTIVIPNSYTNLNSLVNIKNYLFYFNTGVGNYRNTITFESNIIYLNNITQTNYIINCSQIYYFGYIINFPKLSISSLTYLNITILNHELDYIKYNFEYDGNDDEKKYITINQYKSLINLNSITKVDYIYKYDQNNLSHNLNIYIDENFSNFINDENVEYHNIVDLYKINDGYIKFNELHTFNITKYSTRNMLCITGNSVNNSNFTLKNICIKLLFNTNDAVYFYCNTIIINIVNVSILTNNSNNRLDVKFNDINGIFDNFKLSCNAYSSNTNINNSILYLKNFIYYATNTLTFNTVDFQSKENVNNSHILHFSNDVKLSLYRCTLKDDDEFIIKIDNISIFGIEHAINIDVRYTYFKFSDNSDFKTENLFNYYLQYTSDNNDYIINESIFAKTFKLVLTGNFKQVLFNINHIEYSNTNSVIINEYEEKVTFNNETTDENYKFLSILFDQVNGQEIEDDLVINYKVLDTFKYNINYNENSNLGKNQIGAENYINVYVRNYLQNLSNDITESYLIFEHNNSNEYYNQTLTVKQSYNNDNPCKHVYIKVPVSEPNKSIDILLTNFNNITQDDLKFTKDSLNNNIKLNSINYKDYDYFDISHINIYPNNSYTNTISFNITKTKHLKVSKGRFDLNYNDLIDIEDEYLKCCCLGNLNYNIDLKSYKKPNEVNILTLRRELYNKFTDEEKEQLITCWKTINIRENESA